MADLEYRTLDPRKVIVTIDRLQQRIGERFPESGLRKVCEDLLTVAQETEKRVAWIAKPILALRIGIGVVMTLILLAIAASIQQLNIAWGNFNLGELLQILEATTNEIVLIGAATFFLFTIERRIKRARAQKALHELRALAHVIDMHQLTKDPSRDPSKDTASSPRVALTPFELIRYLDYCSEMLSLIAKITALYAQTFQDEVVLDTVNEVEVLSTNLCNQVWQKISIIYEEQSEGLAQPDIPPTSTPPAS